MKKLIAFVLVAVLLLTALVSCIGNTPEDTSPDTTPQKNMVVLFENGVESPYKVLYDDNATSAVSSAASDLAYQISRKFDIEVTASREFAEWGIDSAVDTEIIIGDTLRPETAETKKLLQGAENEYAIKLFENGKLAFVGSNEESLVKGIVEFTATYVTGNTNDTLELEEGFESYVKLPDTERAEWRLGNSIPEYTAGLLSERSYNIGYNMSVTTNSGKMQIAYDTTAEEFDAYLETLATAGFKTTASNEVNGSKFVQLKSSKALVYTYYLASSNEVRIINDGASCLEEDFEYTYTAKEGDTAGIYQFAMMYDPIAGGAGNASDGKYPNNGTFHIIRLSDNSLILIDGGGSVQATEEATEALLDFLYQITGIDKDSGEKIRIAAWYISHGHGDHLYFARNLFRDYSDKVELERVMHNLPSIINEQDSNLAKMATDIQNNYDNVKFMKLHTGQKIQLADATIDVLLTHEDLVNPKTGYTYIEDYNDTSSIIKITVNGVSYISFGDWGGQWTIAQEPNGYKNYYRNEEIFLSIYREDDGSYPVLESDVVQIAHHAINNWLDKIYIAVDPDYAFIPQADVEWTKYQGNCFQDIVTEMRNLGMPDENIYHASRNSHWLIIEQDGTITHGQQAITGYDEGYYYYTDSEGNTLYEDENGVVSTDTSGTMIKDSTGTRTFSGMTGVKSVYEKGYMDYIAPYNPFYTPATTA